MPRWVLPILFLVSGCKAPPDAPIQLDALCAWMFAHFDDDDPRNMRAGAENLDVWLGENLDATLEGYTVNNLSPSDVQNLPLDNPSVDSIVGAAVGHVSPYGVLSMADPLVVEDQTQVFPDSFDAHQRTFLTDPTCFVDESCDVVRTENEVESSYALGLKVSTHGRADYRWVDLGHGNLALVHRTFLLEPADTSFAWLQINAQYFIGVMLPQDDGTTRRVSATWISAIVGASPVPKATALNLIIKSMQSDSTDLDTWLDDNR